MELPPITARVSTNITRNIKFFRYMYNQNAPNAHADSTFYEDGYIHFT